MTASGYAKIVQDQAIETNLRLAKPYICRKCGKACLRGDDHDRCAMTVTVDAEPVDRAGEAVAVLCGLSTYSLWPTAGKAARPNTFELNHREPWHYCSPVQKYPVHVQHRCERQS